MTPPRRASRVFAAGVIATVVACNHKPPPPVPTRGTVAHLSADRLAPGAYGRAADMVLEDEPHGVLTFADARDAHGHRPLRGALVDVGLHDGGDVPDPLITWSPGWRGKDGTVHVGPMESVEELACGTTRGIHLRGAVDGVRLDTSVCPSSSGYRATTTASSLPDGAALVDEVNAGASHVLVQGGGTHVEGDVASPFFGITNDAIGWLLE
jgi:hypothetical protein